MTRFSDWVKEHEGDFASSSSEGSELRLECLRVAADVAKLGLSHNVFATAESYYKFVTGQPTEDRSSGLSFIQRLDALILEFLREEKSDRQKIVHDLQEYMEGLTEKQHDSEPEFASPDHHVPIMQHRNINA